MRRLCLLVFATLILSLAGAPPAGAEEGDPVRFFTTDLSGAEERPGPGDPDGRGFAHVVTVPSIGLLCYVIFVQNVTLPATGAHIHQAPAGEPGPVVIPLKNPNAAGFSSGCVQGDPDIQGVHDNPEAYYVNVHNDDYPGGAVRGQLEEG